MPRKDYGEPDPHSEVDMLLAARNPHFGISASGPGHETRLHALRELRTYSPGRESRALQVLLVTVAVSIVAVFVISILLSGPREGAANAVYLLSRFAIGGAFLALIFAAILGGFLALMFIVGSPRRIVNALRRGRSNTKV